MSILHSSNPIITKDPERVGCMWQSLTVDEYAELERACGSVTLNYGGVWWRRVRPLLYRPLDPFQPTSCDAIRPHLGPFTSVQHHVKDAVFVEQVALKKQ